MDFMLSMFIFANGEYFTREGPEMEEALRGCRASSSVDNNRGVAADQGKPQRQKEPQAQPARGQQQQKQQLQGIRPWPALEFDGLNCFETFISHH